MERMGGFNPNAGEKLPSSMIGLEKDNQTKMEFFEDKKSEEEIQKYENKCVSTEQTLCSFYSSFNFKKCSKVFPNV